MPIGRGKYDDIFTVAREGAKAARALLVVVGGSRGHGFSIQTAFSVLTTKLPEILRDFANRIESDVKHDKL